jgi:predicted pyridoxine 5'-phosphate oxidase superfamily flavin-nucleotide-binding protein
MFDAEFHRLMHSSVLCWLATVDRSGQPNVSPKEVFAAVGDRHLVLANIASPTSVHNVLAGSRACASFIDIFVQKGYKVTGPSRYIRRDSTEFSQWGDGLVDVAEPKFSVRGVIVVEAECVESIVAPSYRIDPGLSEESQVMSALKTYDIDGRLGGTSGPSIESVLGIRAPGGSSR